MKIAYTHPFLLKGFTPSDRKNFRFTPWNTRTRSDAEALVIDLTVPITRRELDLLPRLRALGTLSAGLNHIDLAECERRGIAVTSTPGVLSRATAELTLALLLGVAKRIPEGEALCRSGKFKGWAPDLLLGIELGGKTAVLVGRGRIGEETARLFRGIGMKVKWITRSTSEREISRLLRTADVLSFHTPLEAGTRHWLSAKRLALLPRHAIVLNTARGPVIDEKALIRALHAQKIFGAGLDVFEREPEIPASLRRLKNVVLLPHVGSATTETRLEMARVVAKGVLASLGSPRSKTRT